MENTVNISALMILNQVSMYCIFRFKKSEMDIHIFHSLEITILIFAIILNSFENALEELYVP